MALQNSGAISLDDIHVEAGGTSGTSASINDSDIRDMIDKSDGATASFDEYYGASSSTHIGGTGGSTTTSGNYKYHYFTSSGTLSLTSIGSGGPSNTVDYIIIAGGVGSFEPRKLTLKEAEKFENKSLFYAVRDKEKFKITPVAKKFKV